MSVRDTLLGFLRTPGSFALGSQDPEIWLSGLKDFAEPQLEHRGDYPLRPAQTAAWVGLSSSRAGLVLGPPGTGKTHLLAWLIVAYVQARRAAGLPARVFVSAFTRNAIGHLLDSVARLAAIHAPGLIDVHYVGAAPPAGLASSIRHRERLGTGDADAALTDLQASAVVVGGTIWALARLMARPGAGGDGFTAELFDMVCIDEASQMVVSHGLMALAGLKDTGRVIVAGDDRQLPPIRASRDIRLGDRELGGSLYGFLKSGDVPEFGLEETFRLNGPLAAFPRKVFYDDVYRSVEAAAVARLALVEDWRTGLKPWEVDALDPEWPVVVILHDGPPAATQNLFEADLAARLAQKLSERMVGAQTAHGLADSFWKDALAIVSPHRAQNIAIRNALSPVLTPKAFVETVDRIQGKERDAVIMSYCVADAEFAVAEADFIFAPERLNVAVTRARTKLIMLVSRRLLDAVPGDQEAMDNAELLREFVFGAAPKQIIKLDDAGRGTVSAELRLRGFDAPPIFDTEIHEPEADEPVDEILSAAESQLLDAIRTVALRDASGMADIKALKNALATQRDLLPDLSRLHALGWINLTESTRYGSYWRARPLEPRRRVFATDLETVRLRIEGVISQARSGRAPPFYDPKVRERFAWMSGKGVDVLRPAIDRLKEEGLILLATANGSLTVDWAGDAALDDASETEIVGPDLSDADFEVLNLLETLEASRINFGVFEGWTSIAGLAASSVRPAPEVAASVGRLASQGWVLRGTDDRVRSRMAELAREIRYVKQRFRHDDMDSRPYLVRSLKLELLERDKPERRDRLAEILPKAATGLDEAHGRALGALGAMLERRWGAQSAVAGFQTRSLIALSQAWAAGPQDAYVIAADTGSGKTEAMALPLIAAAAADRMRGTRGVRAVLAYPRIRLATNQAQRLAGYLADFANESGMPTVTLGLQVGQVPRSFHELKPRDEEAGWRRVGEGTFTFPFFACPVCESDLLLDHDKGVEGADKLSCTRCAWSFAGWVGSKDGLREEPPALFLPTTDSLHQWMHNPLYGRLFGDDPGFSPPRAVIADEIHLYSHIHGAQVGLTLRRLAARSAMNDPGSPRMLAIGMSATLGDPARAWERLIDRPAVLLAPERGEKTPNPRGREYFFFVQPEIESRGKDIAGASTTIQTLMCLAHGMRRRTGAQGGFRSLAFLDSIDKVRRLHAAYADAEAFKKLASLRTRDYPDDPLTGSARNVCCGQPHGCDVFNQGECWWFAANDAAQTTAAGRRKAGAPLSVAEQPVFSGTSGRVEAMIKRSDIVFATSSLEVGYDDPDINLVYQHYAPQNLASFIQRKGRAGRGTDDRPVTGVTLSLYSSRDSWWFRQPRKMISPVGLETPLNPDNYFVRRGQLLSAVLDSFARTHRSGPAVTPGSPHRDAWTQAERFVEMLFGPEPWSEFQQPSLQALYERALAADGTTPATLTSLPAVREGLGWIPTTLFESINLPRLAVCSDGAKDSDEDIGLALATAAPGNATRRYDGVNIYWRAPQEGLAPWLTSADYDQGAYHPFDNGSEGWRDHLPIEALPLLTDLRETYFRPARITLDVLGKMHGSGWKSDWEVGAGSPPTMARIRDAHDETRLVRHDSRGYLRGFPVIKVRADAATLLPLEALDRWLARVEAYRGDGLSGKTTGLSMAQVYWAADADAPLSGPPSESARFTQVFTAPDDPRPLLHGYHVQTEGVRFVLDATRLAKFVAREGERIEATPEERAWREGQMFRYALHSRALAAGLNGFDAQRMAELLVSTIADRALKTRLAQVVRFWDPDDLGDLLEATRAGYLSHHPMFSIRRVEGLKAAFGDERGRQVIKASLDALKDSDFSRRHLTSAVVHSLGIRLKESFIQTARGDDRRIVMHSRLPVQFDDLAEAVITVCENGSYGDGTTRAFIAHFEEAKTHWVNGLISDCPNAQDDAAVERLFERVEDHKAWRRLDPTDPKSLGVLADALGFRDDAACPALVLRILFDYEQIGLDRIALYDLAIELRAVETDLRETLKRRCSGWELVSAAIDKAKKDPARVAARLLAAYASVDDAALDDSLSPENRLADQLYRLGGRLCIDGCQACVHQASDLMAEGLVQASTSRALLNRFICDPIP